jgi:hypothetical protein
MPSLSVLALLAANLIPLFGVLFWGWSLSAVMVLYWSENVVIGVFNVLKMALAQGEVKDSGMRLNNQQVTAAHRVPLIVFFMVHFGMFTLGHGVFVFILFGKDLPAFSILLPAFLSLIISHGISFGVNFIQKGEYHRVSFPSLFLQPYKRIVIMHLTIILGAWASAAWQLPEASLFILIGLKVIVDLFSHKKEHKKFSA